MGVNHVHDLCAPMAYLILSVLTLWPAPSEYVNNETELLRLDTYNAQTSSQTDVRSSTLRASSAVPVLMVVAGSKIT